MLAGFKFVQYPMKGSQVVALFWILLSLMRAIFPWTVCPRSHGMENREMVGSPMTAKEGKWSANIIVPRSGKHRSTNSAGREYVLCTGNRKRPSNWDLCQFLHLVLCHLQVEKNTQMDLYVLWTKITPLLKC